MHISMYFVNTIMKMHTLLEGFRKIKCFSAQTVSTAFTQVKLQAWLHEKRGGENNTGTGTYTERREST